MLWWKRVHTYIRTYTVHIRSPGGNRTINVRVNWTFIRFECYMTKLIIISSFLLSLLSCFLSLRFFCVYLSLLMFYFLLYFLHLSFTLLLLFIAFFFLFLLCFCFSFFVQLLCLFYSFVYISVLAAFFLFLSVTDFPLSLSFCFFPSVIVFTFCLYFCLSFVTCKGSNIP